MRALARRTVTAGVFALLAGACAAPASDAPSWYAVPLPAGAAPVTVTASGAELLVGTSSSADPPAPGLLRRRGQGWQAMAVRPTSGYAQQATWLSIQAGPDGSLVAVGGARGGAHANVRWTVWRGAPGEGLTEQVQGFNVFGGWGAGDITAVVAAPSGPMLVGSWQSDQAGLDIAVWLPVGQQWVRQPAVGTARESRRNLLVGPRSATDDGVGALVVGSAVPLTTGAVVQTPAAWISERGDTGWRRIDLPAGGRSGEAVSARCSVGGACTIVGWVGEQLAAWRIEAGAARQLEGLPPVPASSSTPMPTPALREGRAILLVGEASGSVVLTEGPSGWDRRPGPAGLVTQFALVGSSGYAVTSSGEGPATLWCSPNLVDAVGDRAGGSPTAGAAGVGGTGGGC